MQSNMMSASRRLNAGKSQREIYDELPLRTGCSGCLGCMENDSDESIPWTPDVDTVALKLAYGGSASSKVTTCRNPAPDLLSNAEWKRISSEVDEVFSNAFPATQVWTAWILAGILGLGLQTVFQVLGIMFNPFLLIGMPAGYVISWFMVVWLVVRPSRNATYALLYKVDQLNARDYGPGARFSVVQSRGPLVTLESTGFSTCGYALGNPCSYLVIRYPPGKGPRNRKILTTATCPACRNATEPGQYCGLCGVMLQPACDRCGHAIDRTATFCNNCGNATSSRASKANKPVDEGNGGGATGASAAAAVVEAPPEYPTAGLASAPGL